MDWQGIYYSTRSDVYTPSDDTYLLAEAVADAVQPGMRVLDLGCGTGIVGLAAARAGAHVTLADLNPGAVRLAKENALENGLDVEAIVSDLLADVNGPFDMVAFNPPYLPTAHDEHVEGALDIAFDGGPDGNRVVLRFAEQVADLEPRPPLVLLVHSSLSKPSLLDEEMEKLGYTARVAAKRRFPWEELTLREYRSSD